MKKIILMIAILGFTKTFSQNDSVKGRVKDGLDYTKTDSIVMNKTCITLRSGKLMVVKNGKLVPMTEAMLMQNGTIVSMDGTIKTKDGKETHIAEGDCLNMYGEMIPLYDGRMLNDGPPK